MLKTCLPKCERGGRFSNQVMIRSYNLFPLYSNHTKLLTSKKICRFSLLDILNSYFHWIRPSQNCKFKHVALHHEGINPNMEMMVLFLLKNSTLMIFTTNKKIDLGKEQQVKVDFLLKRRNKETRQRQILSVEIWE